MKIPFRGDKTAMPHELLQGIGVCLLSFSQIIKTVVCRIVVPEVMREKRKVKRLCQPVHESADSTTGKF